MKIFYNFIDILSDECYYPYYDSENLIKEINTIVCKKFSYYIDKTLSFVAELYIESEWRELVAIHYCKTNYNTNKTIRVHLISKQINNIQEINNDNYLGYITLRPLPIHTNSIISRARLVFDEKLYGIVNEKDRYKMNKISTKVSIRNIELKYETFPYISQDSVVIVCAHADLLMLSKYMYKNFCFSLLGISELLSYISPHNGRKIPSQGLTVEQIVHVLNESSYNPSLFELVELEMSIENKRFQLSFEEIVDTAIRSNLPVLFIFEQHVVLISGYIAREDNTKEYIIFDDSSYFISKYFNGSSIYSANVKIEKIKEVIHNCKECDTQYIIIPTFDKFYFKYKDLYVLLKYKIEPFIKENNKSIKMLKYEASLIESKELIRKYENFDNIVMPRYVWYVKWFDDNQVIGYSVIDATAHKNDYSSSLICLYVNRKEFKNRKINNGG